MKPRRDLIEFRGGGRVVQPSVVSALSLSPAIGVTAGSTAVTITGTGLQSASGVTFGGAAATSVVVVSDTSVTCVTPAGSRGHADVAVALAPGTATGSFTYYTTPVVTSVSSAVATTAGLTSVTITGTGFLDATGATFGGSAATVFAVVDSTTITCKTPAHAAGAVDVVVTNPATTGTGTGVFTYYAIPTVTSCSPSAGLIGGSTSITITGTGFTGATSATVGGVSATSLSVVNSTTITCVTGAHAAGTVDIIVTNPATTGTGTNKFSYFPTPTVTSVSSAVGITTGGEARTITGTNFTGATGATFGGAAATSFVVVNSTTITCVTPSGSAGAVDVVVSNPAASGTGSSAFTYYLVPTVTSVSPSQGSTAGSTAVTITGTNFTSATGATLGGVALTSFSVVNSTTITGTSGAHAAGTVSCVVTNPATTATLTTAFSYVSFDPASLGLTLWLTPNYAGASPWIGKPSAGTSASQDATGSTLPTTGSAVSGWIGPLFNSGTQNFVLDDTLDTYANASAFSGWALVNVTNIAVDSATASANQAILATATSGRMAVYFRNTGLANTTYTVGLDIFDSGSTHRPVTTAFLLNTWQLVQWKSDGSTVKIRVNGGTWASATGGSFAAASLTFGVLMGVNTAVSIGFRGTLLEKSLSDTVISDANFDNVLAYARDKYGLALT